jgi:hypothetical protein
MIAVLSALLLFLASATVVLNWIHAGQTIARRLRGDRRTVSLVYAVPQILVWMAAVLHYRADPPTLPAWLFATVALADVSLYCIVFALVSAPIRRWRARARSSVAPMTQPPSDFQAASAAVRDSARSTSGAG